MRVNPLRFAVLAPALLAAHTIGDHIAQTDHQAAQKAESWRAMGGHVASYQAIQVLTAGAVLGLTGLRCPWRAVLTGAVFSAVTHAVLDRRWPVQEVLRRTGSPRFAEMVTPVNGMYQADQALHHGCLLIAALLMAAGQ